MPRQSSNFQVTQLLDTTQLQTVRSNFNDFGNFTYQDHVTRLKYGVNNLKTTSTGTGAGTNSTHQSKYFQTLNKNSLGNINNHKANKSTGSMSKFFKQIQRDEMQIKQWQLSHFLQQLVMVNRIRDNRNYIVSGNQKNQKRRSFLPSTYSQSSSVAFPKINTKTHHKQQTIDILKQQVRKQVNSLNNQLFRQYLQKNQPYRIVFGELNKVSNKGALNTNKIKQIKQKIKQCAKQTSDVGNNMMLIKRQKLESKQNQRFDKYFDGVWKQLDQEIHLKMKHQASFNWKYGKKSSLDQIIDNYGHQMHLQAKNA